MSRRELFGVGAAACVTCCIAPILGVLGGIGAAGLVSALFIGAAGLGIAVAVLAAIILVRHRRTPTCDTDGPVAVGLTRRK